MSSSRAQHSHFDSRTLDWNALATRSTRPMSSSSASFTSWDSTTRCTNATTVPLSGRASSADDDRRRLADPARARGAVSVPRCWNTCRTTPALWRGTTSAGDHSTTASSSREVVLGVGAQAAKVRHAKAQHAWPVATAYVLRHWRPVLQQCTALWNHMGHQEGLQCLRMVRRGQGPSWTRLAARQQRPHGIAHKLGEPCSLVTCFGRQPHCQPGQKMGHDHVLWAQRPTQAVRKRNAAPPPVNAVGRTRLATRSDGSWDMASVTSRAPRLSSEALWPSLPRDGGPRDAPLDDVDAWRQDASCSTKASVTSCVGGVTRDDTVRVDGRRHGTLAGQRTTHLLAEQGARQQ